MLHYTIVENPNPNDLTVQLACPVCSGKIALDVYAVDFTVDSIICPYCKQRVWLSEEAALFSEMKANALREEQHRILLEKKGKIKTWIRTSRQIRIITEIQSLLEAYGIRYQQLYLEKRKGLQFIDGRSMKFFGLSCRELTDEQSQHLDMILKRHGVSSIFKPRNPPHTWSSSLYIFNLESRHEDA